MISRIGATPGGQSGVKPTVLVCDDEPNLRWSICELFGDRGYRAIPAADGLALLDEMAKVSPDLIVLDMNMPRMGGIDALRELRRRGADVPVVILTASGSIERAVEAAKLGIDRWLEKPFQQDQLMNIADEIIGKRRRRRRDLLPRQRERTGYGEFVGAAPALGPIFATLRSLEGVDPSSVLIQGETGTGKDIIARMIHRHGPRRDRPFVAVDCTSLPADLVESELFGHEKGAFTDAQTLKHGLFESAAGGVLFLDEIGEIPLVTQAKLLRAIEDRTYRRVGATQRLPLDVGIIAATNRDLGREAASGRFRPDLFFRLDVVQIHVPPLRQRSEDIPLLIEHLMGLVSRRLGRSIPDITGPAVDLLVAYGWPGNVRELRNLLERLVLLTPKGEPIKPADLPPEIRYARGSDALGRARFELPPGGVVLDTLERDLVVQALERTQNNVSSAAKLVGLSRDTMRYRLKRWGIES